MNERGPDAGPFLPGRVLADRYRVVERIGEGGMGVVYRVEDLKLGQPVALKFLPPEVGRDPQRLQQLFAEVRLARQVSHPHVCRVHDVDEIDGTHFLSMEFVDGEDLASLLRRIGRLPPDKAADFAREICAGLSAIHARGVLHRDLKPANVMIDGRGHARITDFGLAELQSARVDPELIVGTPAYMAPETLIGGAPSVQSDLYGLGLVMFELFTGRPAHTAASMQELIHLRRDTPAPSPSQHRPDLDPRVEKAIRACLDPEPAKRPRSAEVVAATLPGGDPIAAALAAGKTPSPEAVAAPTRGAEGLRLAAAWPLLLALLAGLTVLTITAPLTRFLSRHAIVEPPDAMAGKAREHLADVGLRDPDAPPGDQAYDYAIGQPSEPALVFWYRESAGELVGKAPGFRVTYDDPPHRSGAVAAKLDLAGQAVSFDGNDSAPTPPPASWSGRAIRPILFLAALGLGAWLAARNRRAGRGDARRATRVALVMFGMRIAAWLLGAHLTLGSLTEQIASALAWGLFDFAYGWIFYMAIEPYVRRLWPRVLTSWTRLLDGRFGDARVGRDLLIGAAMGTAVALAVVGYQAALAALGVTPQRLDGVGYVEHQLHALLGLRYQLADTLELYRSNILQVMGFLVILLAARLTLRHAAVALAAAFLVFVPLTTPEGGVPALDFGFGAAVAALWLTTLMRVGLLATIAGVLAFVTLQAAPIGVGWGGWATSRSLLALLLVAGVGLYGFRHALAGRPAVKDVIA